MSRIGRKPISIPSGVDIKSSAGVVSVKGPLGQLEWKLDQALSVSISDGNLQISCHQLDDSHSKAMYGLTRAELNNMVIGVTKGYERNLEVTGVGYKANLQGQTLNFSVGFTHPVPYEIPKGVEIKVDKQTLISLKGIDKRLIGQVSANLRAIKPPDVYKQKGIRYAGEVLRKKEGKTGKK
jgi:large subunit ribosomal protein L6